MIILFFRKKTKEEKWQSPKSEARVLPCHDFTDHLRVIFILASLPHPFLEQEGASYLCVLAISFAIEKGLDIVCY